MEIRSYLDFGRSQETLVDKIYLDNPKEIQTFVKEVKNLIEDLTSKVKNKQLTVKEQESLPLLINNLNQVILNIHKKEISLFNEKIGGQLGLLNDTLNLLGPIPSSSKDMDLFLNRWNFLIIDLVNASNDQDIKTISNQYVDLIRDRMTQAPTQDSVDKVKDGFFLFFQDLKKNKDLEPILEVNQLYEAKKELDKEIALNQI